MQWKKLVKLIPSKVQIKQKTDYEIVWTEEHVSEENLGETRFDPKQIVISKDQCDKEKVHTYWHEVLHAISHEYGADLTETQVLKLEKALYYLLKPNNLFKSR